MTVPSLTCDVNSNMFMSYESIDQRAEIRAVERGSSATRARNSRCRRGGVACARMWNIAASCVSLRGKSAIYRTAGSGSVAVVTRYVQDSGRSHPASASLFGRQRNHPERSCNASAQSVSVFCKQAWLSAVGGNHLMSVMTTSSIVCSLRNCSKPTRYLFPIVFAPKTFRPG